jgi:hypothetical protein
MHTREPSSLRLVVSLSMRYYFLTLNTERRTGESRCLYLRVCRVIGGIFLLDCLCLQVGRLPRLSQSMATIHAA